MNNSSNSNNNIPHGCWTPLSSSPSTSFQLLEAPASSSRHGSSSYAPTTTHNGIRNHLEGKENPPFAVGQPMVHQKHQNHHTTDTSILLSTRQQQQQQQKNESGVGIGGPGTLRTTTIRQQQQQQSSVSHGTPTIHTATHFHSHLPHGSMENYDDPTTAETTTAMTTVGHHHSSILKYGETMESFFQWDSFISNHPHQPHHILDYQNLCRTVVNMTHTTATTIEQQASAWRRLLELRCPQYHHPPRWYPLSSHADATTNPPVPKEEDRSDLLRLHRRATSYFTTRLLLLHSTVTWNTAASNTTTASTTTTTSTTTAGSSSSSSSRWLLRNDLLRIWLSYATVQAQSHQVDAARNTLRYIQHQFSSVTTPHGMTATTTGPSPPIPVMRDAAFYLTQSSVEATREDQYRKAESILRGGIAHHAEPVMDLYQALQQLQQLQREQEQHPPRSPLGTNTTRTASSNHKRSSSTISTITATTTPSQQRRRIGGTSTNHSSGPTRKDPTRNDVEQEDDPTGNMVHPNGVGDHHPLSQASSSNMSLDNTDTTGGDVGGSRLGVTTTSSTYQDYHHHRNSPVTSNGAQPVVDVQHGTTAIALESRDSSLQCPLPAPIIRSTDPPYPTRPTNHMAFHIPILGIRKSTSSSQSFPLTQNAASASSTVAMVTEEPYRQQVVDNGTKLNTFIDMYDTNVPPVATVATDRTTAPTEHHHHHPFVGPHDDHHASVSNHPLPGTATSRMGSSSSLLPPTGTKLTRGDIPPVQPPPPPPPTSISKSTNGTKSSVRMVSSVLSKRPPLQLKTFGLGKAARIDPSQSMMLLESDSDDEKNLSMWDNPMDQKDNRKPATTSHRTKATDIPNQAPSKPKLSKIDLDYMWNWDPEKRTAASSSSSPATTTTTRPATTPSQPDTVPEQQHPPGSVPLQEPPFLSNGSTDKMGTTVTSTPSVSVSSNSTNSMVSSSSTTTTTKSSSSSSSSSRSLIVQPAVHGGDGTSCQNSNKSHCNNMNTVPSGGGGTDGGIVSTKVASNNNQRNDSISINEEKCRREEMILPIVAAVSSNVPTGSKINPDFVPLIYESNMIRVNGDPYVKLGVIGKGGSCKVYRVLSKDCSVLAIKKVKLNDLDKKAIAGYANEIALLKRLRGNPAIIQLQDSEVDTSRQVILLVMEAGEVDLNHILQRQSVQSSGNNSIQERSLNMNFIRLTWQVRSQFPPPPYGFVRVKC
jgi:hypothetical protein